MGRGGLGSAAARVLAAHLADKQLRDQPGAANDQEEPLQHVALASTQR